MKRSTCELRHRLLIHPDDGVPDPRVDYSFLLECIIAAGVRPRCDWHGYERVKRLIQARPLDHVTYYAYIRALVNYLQI